jgi:hypothetical protein
MRLISLSYIYCPCPRVRLSECHANNRGEEEDRLEEYGEQCNVVFALIVTGWLVGREGVAAPPPHTHSAHIHSLAEPEFIDFKGA